MTARLVVLVSGSGTNLQAILDACASGHLDAIVLGVISNKPDVLALERASRSGVEAIVVQPFRGEQRSDYDARLAAIVEGFAPDLVVLAGFMRLLTLVFVGRFRVLNLHPALPGELPGLDAIERAFAQWQAGERSRSGVMVHWVPDAGVDDGPTICTEEVPFLDGDSLESFEDRLHQVEHQLLIRALQQVLDPNYVDPISSEQ